MINKRFIVLLAAVLQCISFSSDAQVTFQKMYGGNSGSNTVTCHQQTIDGGYILAGYTNAFGSGSYNFYIVKVEQGGDIEWSKSYGGFSVDLVAYIQQTSDNGFVILGSSSSFGPYETLLIKTNPQGNIEWSRFFSGSGYDGPQVVKQTLDGGYIIAGNSVFFNYNYFLIKTNSFGDIIWQHTYDEGSSDDQFKSLIQTTDEGYLMTGYSCNGKLSMVQVECPCFGNHLS